MIDTDIIETALDQPSELDVDLSWVDHQILGFIKNDALEAATNMVLEMKRTAQIAGLSLAITLYHFEQNWARFERDDTFEDYMMARTGYHSHTISRYLKVGKLLREGAPEEFRKELTSKTMNQLMPIANAVAQGYEIDTEIWKDLVQAQDSVIVRDIIRDDVREAAPRSTALSLWLDRQGTIWAFVGKTKERKFVGSLEVNNDDPDIQKAIERIIKNSGMLKD